MKDICSSFGVARLCEAVRAREAAGDGSEVLVMLDRYADIETAAKYDVTLSASSLKELKHIKKEGQKLKKPVKIHIKTDSGFNRLGVKDFDEFNKMLAACGGGIKLTGIYTHFADFADREFTKKQFLTFLKYVKAAKRLFPELRAHCATAGAAFADKKYCLDMVRSGINIYGYRGEEAAKKGVPLKPAMEIFAPVMAVKRARKGESVGYCRKYIASSDIYYAVISAGYGDGYNRGLSGRGSVMINGRMCGVIGNVCMDAFMVNLGKSRGGAKTGDTATLFSPHHGERLTLEYNSALLNTIVYELLTSFKAAQRVYVTD